MTRSHSYFLYFSWYLQETMLTLSTSLLMTRAHTPNLPLFILTRDTSYFLYISWYWQETHRTLENAPKSPIEGGKTCKNGQNANFVYIWCTYQKILRRVSKILRRHTTERRWLLETLCSVTLFCRQDPTDIFFTSLDTVNKPLLLADPGEARGCSISSLIIHHCIKAPT